MTLVKSNHPMLRSNANEMRNQFHDFFLGLANLDFSLQLNAKSALVNISEDEKSFDLTFSVAEFKKEDFQIEIKDQMLVLLGEQKENKETNEKKFTRKEFGLQNLKRAFKLPDNIDNDNIEARFDNGILFVSLHKKIEAKKEAKKIDIR